jgi:signal peptidase I
MRNLLGWLLTLALVALLLTLVAVRPFAVDVLGMPSEAMAPTVIADSSVRVDKLGFGIASLTNIYWRYAPPSRSLARGDVVVFRLRGEPMLGRVVALPGDDFRFGDDGVLKIDGTPVQRERVEDAVATAAGWETWQETIDGRSWHVRLWRTGKSSRISGRREVKPGTVFVLGDSRDQSVDSRELGGIALEDVLGVVTGTSAETGLSWPTTPPSWPVGTSQP